MFTFIFCSLFGHHRIALRTVEWTDGICAQKKKKLHEQIKCRAIHENVGDDEDEDGDDDDNTSTQTETTRILKRGIFYSAQPKIPIRKSIDQRSS